MTIIDVMMIICAVGWILVVIFKKAPAVYLLVPAYIAVIEIAAFVTGNHSIKYLLTVAVMIVLILDKKTQKKE